MADIKIINLNGTDYNIVDDASRTVANEAKTAAEAAATYDSATNTLTLATLA